MRQFPTISGRPVRVEFLPALSARRGRLLSRQRNGMPVHAGTFLRQRRIVLDAALAGNSRELERIFTHEIFHFVWMRLGNPRRRSYEALVAAELRRRVKGELGWSAESRKQKLTPQDRLRRTLRWREYCCESFCDSGAWLLTGGRHAEFTLPARARARRRAWLDAHGIPERIWI